MVAGVKRTTLDAAQTGQELLGDMSVAAEVQRNVAERLSWHFQARRRNKLGQRV
jgi:hypothetical protein